MIIEEDFDIVSISLEAEDKADLNRLFDDNGDSETVAKAIITVLKQYAPVGSNVMVVQKTSSGEVELRSQALISGFHKGDAALFSAAYDYPRPLIEIELTIKPEKEKITIDVLAGGSSIIIDKNDLIITIHSRYEFLLKGVQKNDARGIETVITVTSRKAL